MRDLFGEHKVNYATTGTESGRTMLEMLGVLAIMGIITYGAIAGINYGMSSYKINQTYSEVQDIIQGVEDLYSWSKCYPSSQQTLMEAIVKNDIFTNNTLSSNDFTVQGTLGRMSVVPDGDSSQCPDGLYPSFKIVIPVAKKDECDRLSKMDWKANSINCHNNGADCDRTECGDSGSTLEFSPK